MVSRTSDGFAYGPTWGLVTGIEILRSDSLPTMRAARSPARSRSTTRGGVVPISVEIEVAVQPTPREFSGRLPEGTADEEDCQEDNANGSISSSAARHPR